MQKDQTLLLRYSVAFGFGFDDDASEGVLLENGFSSAIVGGGHGAVRHEEEGEGQDAERRGEQHRLDGERVHGGHRWRRG